MDMNIIVAGVGGQGILSIAFVLDNAAMKEGYHFKQAEVHGMSQRGGAVQSHMRFSKETIHSDLIPEGGADLILSVEPLEALRYVHFLKTDGAVVSSASPFVNIPNYPDKNGIYRRIMELDNHVLVDSSRLARLAGNGRAQNMVALGAASHLLPFADETCLEFVALLFKAKGDKIIDVNKRAYAFGRDMAAFYRAGLEAGIDAERLRRLTAVIDPANLEMDAVPIWKDVLSQNPELIPEEPDAELIVPGTVDAARDALQSGKIG